MSEETKDTSDVKITTVEKVKDPKKVEAGKNLGAMSKQAKEKKAMEASSRMDRSEADLKNNESKFCLTNIDPLTAFGVLGVFGLVVYNFSKKSSEDREQSEDHTVLETPKAAKAAKAEETVKTTKPKRVYRELDTLG